MKKSELRQIIKEEIKNIQENKVDNLIIKLKASNKLKHDDPLYKELISTNNKITYCMKNYILLNKEIDPKDEETMINAISTFISTVL